MSRVAVFCPGRGSYTKSSLGSLPADNEWVRSAEKLRAEYGLESLLALDGAERFEVSRHLRPSNVSLLIYLCTMLDGSSALARERAVCVGGNSMGWYTALALAGSLSFEDGFRLVQDMALLQEEAGGGGQVIYPVVDEDWVVQDDRMEAIRVALEASDGQAYPSIRLGGYRVLAGTDAGIEHLVRVLSEIKIKKQTYPIRLAQHGPYHTPLLRSVSAAARTRLARLEFHRPRVPLIDGSGRRYSPWSADLFALREYTFEEQVTTPYDFSLSVAVALKEYAPERIVLPGPGNTLGGVCGQILIEEGWRDIHTRADFDAVQESSTPILESMR